MPAERKIPRMRHRASYGKRKYDYGAREMGLGREKGDMSNTRDNRRRMTSNPEISRKPMQCVPTLPFRRGLLGTAAVDNAAGYVFVQNSKPDTVSATYRREKILFLQRYASCVPGMTECYCGKAGSMAIYAERKKPS